MLTLIVPALNEAQTIGGVIRETQKAIKDIGIQEFTILVADNGSTDDTRLEAQNAGALVVSARQRGYGSACLAALAQNPFPQGIICFLDGDGSDDPADFHELLMPLLHDEMDMVIGSRILGEKKGWVESGALTPVQGWGNRLSGFLLTKTWGLPFTDLGPFRAIRATALQKLEMEDKNWGWTMQMQARAARLNLRVKEVPVHYRRRRGGTSKISGTLKGSAAAGVVILKTYFATLIWRPKHKI